MIRDNRTPRVEGEVEYWLCTGCHQWLPRDHFGSEERSSTGLKEECKGCDRARRRRRSLEAKCKALLNDALREGVVAKPEICSHCGASAKRLIAYHESFYRPLEVAWLCPSCHRGIGIK